MDLKTYFDRACVISLKRTSQRLSEFWKQVESCKWPFCEITVVNAIDGNLCPYPPWWHCREFAWGAFRSHLRVIEDAINNESIQRLLVLEDDCEFVDGFAEKVSAFIDALPSNAELTYFGGQTSHRHQSMRQVNELIIEPESVNRLHCYSLNRSGLSKVYRHLCRMNWKLGEQVIENGVKKWRGAHHIDHHLELLSTNRQIVTYAPRLGPNGQPEWLVNQSASYSEILGRHMPERDFTGKAKPPTVIAVLGPYRGGTSAIAGAMHNLGIIMGHKFFIGPGANPRGCFEALMLYKSCMACYSEPDFLERANYQQRVNLLSQWYEVRKKKAGAVMGAKNPKLCLMVPEMNEAWPGCKFVVTHRSLQHSIDSLRKLGWWAKTTDPKELITRLIQTRDRELDAIPADRKLHVEYEDLLKYPDASLKIIARFAEIEPTPEHFRKATDFLDERFNHHGNGKACENGDCNGECGDNCQCDNGKQQACACR